ncbi:MAG: SurA N-terminal domain-containing protein, partial [Bacteroidales bacterium]|nr:SurA N-terminal domain-containing protein [Bacteroidales bacterium]
MAVLEKIRVKLGAFITVLIAVALLSFIIDPDTLQSTMSMFSSKYDVGEIAGEGISYQDYQKKVEYYSSIYQMSNGSSRNDETQELINNTAWQSEIADRVVVPATLAAGLTLGEEEMYDLTQGNNISPVLSGEASFLDENGNFDRNRVLQFVQAIDQDETNNLGMYWQFLEDNVVKDQLFTKYVSLLGQSAYMNQVELANAIAENNTTYNVDFVMQPYGFAMDSTITVSNAEVKAYYDEHKESYKQVESKDIEYVVFEVAPSAEDIASAQEAFEDTYEEFLKTDNMKNFLSRNSDNKFNTMYFKEGELRSVSLELEKLFEKPKAGNVVAPFQEDNFFYAAKIMDVKQLPDSVFVQHILLQGTDAAKADSIMAVAKKGNFAALAAEFSADQNPNVAEAGDLGWMTQQY